MERNRIALLRRLMRGKAVKKITDDNTGEIFAYKSTPPEVDWNYCGLPPARIELATKKIRRYQECAGDPSRHR